MTRGDHVTVTPHVPRHRLVLDEDVGREQVSVLLSPAGSTHSDPNKSLNWIGPAGAASFAGVLEHCTTLTHPGSISSATLGYEIDIETVGQVMLRALWCSRASGLVFFSRHPALLARYQHEISLHRSHVSLCQ